MNRIVRAAVTAAFFLCLGGLAGVRVAQAAQQCAALTTWESALAEHYQEKKTAVATAVGRSGQTFAMIWYESSSGTWTQLVVNRRGIACHIASGNGGIRRVAAPVKQPVPGSSPGQAGTPPPPPTPTLPQKGGESDAPPALTDEQKRMLKGIIEGRDA
jgi:hypothetical protein